MSYDYRYSKKWRLDRERGITRYIDPAPTRRHIEQLLNLGVSKRAIAQAAGVSPQAITHITRGDNPNITRTIASKILAVKPHQLHQRDGDDFVPRVGVLRRIQALQAIGHSAATIGAAAGVEACVIHNLINQRGPYVSAMNRDRVHAAYTQLWDQPGQSKKTATLARAKGWVPPLGWDDDRIDDPNATPDLGETDRETSRGRPVEHIAEDVEWLLEDDPLATATDLARRLGFRDRSGIQIALRRADRPDLLEVLARNARLTREGTAA